jgi:TRAP-type uncharacterized transport system fused permease subunit
VFCFQPTLIMIGSAGAIIMDAILCAYAIFGVCIALSGYWQRSVPMAIRLAICAVCAVMLWPTTLIVNACGAAALTVLLFPDMKMSVQKIRNRHSAQQE